MMGLVENFDTPIKRHVYKNGIPMGASRAAKPPHFAGLLVSYSAPASHHPRNHMRKSNLTYLLLGIGRFV